MFGIRPLHVDYISVHFVRFTLLNFRLHSGYIGDRWIHVADMSVTFRIHIDCKSVTFRLRARYAPAIDRLHVSYSGYTSNLLRLHHTSVTPRLQVGHI